MDIYFDAEGKVTADLEQAVTAELVTVDELGRETRVYGSFVRGNASEVGDPDQVNDETADVLRGVEWDVYVQEDGLYRLVRTLDEFGSVLEFGLLDVQAQRAQLANFMMLPVWDVMPQELRDEITAFLEDTRPT